MFRIFILLCLSISVGAQTDQIVIHEIEISGNKKTKDYIVLRELEFSKGDTLSIGELNEKIKESKGNLFRTKIFFQSDINWKQIQKNGQEHNLIEVDVEEAWYIYPVVIFELADRNFNVWWNEMGASLKRLNLGLRLDHLNTSGRRDKLHLKAQTGYEEKYEVSYNLPIINNEETIGASVGMLYASRNELGYIAQNNVLLFALADERIFTRMRASGSCTYRPGYQQRHKWSLNYNDHRVDKEFIRELNPNYFRDNRTRLKWFTFTYKWELDNTNHFNFPTHGWSTDFILRKEGLGLTNQVNLTDISLAASRYVNFGKQLKWSLALKGKIRTVLTKGNPGYFHYNGLGYGGNQLRGYELYVIDGLHYGFLKTNINFLFFQAQRYFGKWVFVNQFRHFQVKAYASAAIDVGYARSEYFNEENELNNSLLLGGGPALHILLYNYFLFRMEYSYNRLGESGLFLHFKASF